MNTEIIQFITDLGYNHKQAQIYLTLYQMGSSPASSIATRAGYERVTTYKTLQQMVEDGPTLVFKSKQPLTFQTYP